MALLNSTKAENLGIIVDSAYIKIDSIKTTKVEGDMISSFFISYYQSEAAKDSGLPPFKKARHAVGYNLESTDNAYIQAYNYLKTLSEFENAIDA